MKMVIKPDFEENRANLEKGRVKIDLVIKEEGGTHLFAPSLDLPIAATLMLFLRRCSRSVLVAQFILNSRYSGMRDWSWTATYSSSCSAPLPNSTPYNWSALRSTFAITCCNDFGIVSNISQLQVPKKFKRT